MACPGKLFLLYQRLEAGIRERIKQVLRSPAVRIHSRMRVLRQLVYRRTLILFAQLNLIFRLESRSGERALRVLDMNGFGLSGNLFVNVQRGIAVEVRNRRYLFGACD